MIAKLFSVLFRWLVPPGPTATAAQHYDWRIGISAVLLAVVALLTYENVVPGGFEITRMEDLVEIKKELSSQRTGTILDLQNKRCKVTNPELKELLTQKITEMKIDFRSKNGVEFPMPVCEELK